MANHPQINRMLEYFADESIRIAHEIGILTNQPVRNIQERRARAAEIESRQRELTYMEAQSAKLSDLDRKPISADAKERVLGVYTGDFTRDKAVEHASNKPLVRAELDALLGPAAVPQDRNARFGSEANRPSSFADASAALYEAWGGKDADKEHNANLNNLIESQLADTDSKDPNAVLDALRSLAADED